MTSGANRDAPGEDADDRHQVILQLLLEISRDNKREDELETSACVKDDKEEDSRVDQEWQSFRRKVSDEQLQARLC